MTISYFAMSASAHTIRRPMSDLKLLEADLDEIEARAALAPMARATLAPKDPTTVLVVAALDIDAIWANHRARKSTPTTASTLSVPKLDAAEIRRRLGGGRD